MPNVLQTLRLHNHLTRFRKSKLAKVGKILTPKLLRRKNKTASGLTRHPPSRRTMIGVQVILSTHLRSQKRKPTPKLPRRKRKLASGLTYHPTSNRNMIRVRTPGPRSPPASKRRGTRTPPGLTRHPTSKRTVKSLDGTLRGNQLSEGGNRKISADLMMSKSTVNGLNGALLRKSRRYRNVAQKGVR